MEQSIEIRLSKSKIILLLLGSLIFIFLGIQFTFYSNNYVSSIFENETFILVTGIASISFLGCCLIIALKKLFENRIGLRIDDNGIFDNSSGTSVGLIKWDDIKYVQSHAINSTKFIIVFTSNPEKYIMRSKNIFFRKALESTYRMYGSPISITSISLAIKFDELEKIISDELHKRGINPADSF